MYDLLQILMFIGLLFILSERTSLELNPTQIYDHETLPVTEIQEKHNHQI